QPDQSQRPDPVSPHVSQRVHEKLMTATRFTVCPAETLTEGLTKATEKPSNPDSPFTSSRISMALTTPLWGATNEPLSTKLPLFGWPNVGALVVSVVKTSLWISPGG